MEKEFKSKFIPKCITIRKDQDDFILNEKKIQPNHNSSESRTLINYFLNYPFKKIRST